MDEHRRVTIEKDGDHVLVYLILSDLPPIDRERRIKASENFARLMSRRLAGIEIANGEGAISFRPPDLGERRLQAFTERMEEGINKILFAPLTPRAVDSALDIPPPAVAPALVQGRPLAHLWSGEDRSWRSQDSIPAVSV